MPLYEYQCDACGSRFELIRKFADPPLETCATCGKGPVTKLVSSPAFQFKGSGWYITDYARKSGGSASEGESSSSSTAAAKEGGKDTKDTKDSKDSKEKGSGGDKSAATPAPAAATTTPAKDS